MKIKLEFINQKEPKWHIYYKIQKDSNEGDLIIYKCGDEIFEQANSIDGCDSNMGDINQYLTFYGKVWDSIMDRDIYHILPFKNIAPEDIAYKIKQKTEYIVEEALKDNKQFTGICGICGNNCSISKPIRDCNSVAAIRAIYHKFNIDLDGDKQRDDSNIDEYKLNAEHQAATSLVEANMAEFVARHQEEKEKVQAEREALIAEAYKIAGKVEAFKFVSNFAEIGSLALLKKIKESKVYKDMPAIKTWDNYCKSIGLSRSKVDEDLDNLATFGEKFTADIGSIGIGYRELRQLKKEVKAGNLEVNESEVVIDGEVIPLDDKDELRDALDALLKSKYKEIEEKDRIIEEQQEEIKRVQSSNNNFYKQKEQAEKELEEIKGNGFIGGIPIDENKDFRMIADIEKEVEVMYNHLKVVQEIDTLSDFNKKKLGAVVIKAMNLLHDFHQELCSLGVSGYYGEAFMPDEIMNAEDKLETPSDYLKNNK